MSTKIGVLAVCSACLIAAAVIAVKAMPTTWPLHAVLFVRAVFPSLIDWGDHDAFKKCAGAIEHPGKWPAEQATACDVMHMCANEAPMMDREEKALYAQLRKLGCEEP